MIIRKATAADARDIARIMAGIAAERVHSAITTAWTEDQQRGQIEQLNPREAIHVAIEEAIIGLQTLEQGPFESMAHVAQIGTFLTASARRRGVGRKLFEVTKAFAVSHGYEKFAIQVRGSNGHAQAFYKSLGFLECGRWKAHVCIDGAFDDEVLMELPLE